jgi:hypothetical protein
VKDLRWKAALLLFVIFFALTVTTVAISIDSPKLARLSIPEGITLATKYYPMGDPIDGSGPPHMLT